MIKKIIILSIIFLVTSCDYIQYSPHETLNTDIVYNKKNLELISNNAIKVKDKFTFTLISDSHFAFDTLKMAVKRINNLEIKSDFTIHLGDIADNGLTNEYRISNKIMKKLEHPFLVVLGNHDCLSSGKEIFKNLYGSSDFSFVYGNSKFIIINSNSWEFLDQNVPNLDWLEDQLSDRLLHKHVFVLAHISPFTRGFDTEKEERYKNLMKNYNVTYSIHGHNHKFWKGDYYEDGVEYILLDNIQDHNYVIISVDGDDVNFELKAFSGSL